MIGRIQTSLEKGTTKDLSKDLLITAFMPNSPTVKSHNSARPEDQTEFLDHMNTFRDSNYWQSMEENAELPMSGPNNFLSAEEDWIRTYLESLQIEEMSPDQKEEILIEVVQFRISMMERGYGDDELLSDSSERAEYAQRLLETGKQSLNIQGEAKPIFIDPVELSHNREMVCLWINPNGHEYVIDSQMFLNDPSIYPQRIFELYTVDDYESHSNGQRLLRGYTWEVNEDGHLERQDLSDDDYGLVSENFRQFNQERMDSLNSHLQSFASASDQEPITPNEETWFREQLQRDEVQELSVIDREEFLIRVIQRRLEKTSYQSDIHSENGISSENARIVDHWSTAEDVLNDGGQDIDSEDSAAYACFLLRIGREELGLEGEENRVFTQNSEIGSYHQMLSLYQSQDTGRSYVIDASFHQSGGVDPNLLRTLPQYESMENGQSIVRGRTWRIEDNTLIEVILPADEIATAQGHYVDRRGVPTEEQINEAVASFGERSQGYPIGEDEEYWFLEQIDLIDQEVRIELMTQEQRERLLIQLIQVRMQEATYTYDSESTNGPNPVEAFDSNHDSTFFDVLYDNGQEIDCEDFAEFSRYLIEKGSQRMDISGSSMRVYVHGSAEESIDHGVCIWQTSRGEDYVIDGVFYESHRGKP